MKSKKLIIFDCDGVLVDSEPLAAVAYENVFAKHGIVINLTVFEQCIGMKQTDILKKIEALTGFCLPQADEPDIWTETKLQFDKFLNTTNGLLNFLTSVATSRCVASSSSLERINYSLSTTGLTNFFPQSAIFSSSMVRHGKPAPDLFLFASRQCGFSQENCVVIEDSHFGVQGAVSAGMTAIGFTGGGHSDKDHASRLLASGACAACKNWDEVAEILVKLGFT